MKCFNLDCNEVPDTVLASHDPDFKKGRITCWVVVCDKDIPYGRSYLSKHFPQFPITEDQSPGWLLREQRKRSGEIETLQEMSNSSRRK